MIFAVDLHILIAEVAGPDSSLCLTETKLYSDSNIVLLHDLTEMLPIKPGTESLVKDYHIAEADNGLFR